MASEVVTITYQVSYLYMLIAKCLDRSDSPDDYITLHIHYVWEIHSSVKFESLTAFGLPFAMFSICLASFILSSCTLAITKVCTKFPRSPLYSIYTEA